MKRFHNDFLRLVESISTMKIGIMLRPYGAQSAAEAR
jgi:hypothetical protein